MTSPRVPAPGELFWITLDPTVGHEQAKRRPILVLSAASYNRIGILVGCPLTTVVKGFPFEVRLSGDRRGVVLADQVKGLDWRGRDARFMGSVTPNELAEVRAKMVALIGG